MKRTGKQTISMRGAWSDKKWRNRIGIRDDGVANCITKVAKDSMSIGKVERMSLMIVREPTETEKGAVNLIKKVDIEKTEEKTVEDYLYTAADGEQYGIFKLSPRECGRLMGVLDSDIDKMQAVNSNSQLYKQFGNSIIVPVLVAIFSQLNIQGHKAWNDMTDEERDDLVCPEKFSAED